MVFESLKNVQEIRPLVHTITNFVSMNDCANILLACGARPIMAEDCQEVPEITAASDAVVLNLGTPNSSKYEAMKLAAETASKKGIPIVLDPVGVGASSFRRNMARQFLQYPITLIRGNSAEIGALQDIPQERCGVDEAPHAPEWEERILLAQALSAKTGAVVAMSGATDIVAFEKQVAFIHNGSPELSRITGTGCMLSALCGAFLAANPQKFFAVISAFCMMGVCGQIAAEQAKNFGVGSMRTFLIDAVGNLTTETLEREAVYEFYKE